ncbi:hypothetical protein BDV96DRAFT_690197 [Lophiotrema nucula]|uniref:Uncharacterized protein n=1 Tax=Lophiotrema nucula TaxID=690887 RepID=A0A6A5YXE8_9PLEO|nr:hypothetical protein BDV96DRAFT_690197 [Lophiotrema nucula]
MASNDSKQDSAARRFLVDQYSQYGRRAEQHVKNNELEHAAAIVKLQIGLLRALKMLPLKHNNKPEAGEAAFAGDHRFEGIKTDPNVEHPTSTQLPPTNDVMSTPQSPISPAVSDNEEDDLKAELSSDTNERMDIDDPHLMIKAVEKNAKSSTTGLPRVVARIHKRLGVPTAGKAVESVHIMDILADSYRRADRDSEKDDGSKGIAIEGHYDRDVANTGFEDMERLDEM